MASSAASAIEWFDFFIYGTAAALILKVLFPASDPLVGTLLTFMTYAIGFVARPLGGRAFGHSATGWGASPRWCRAVPMGGSKEQDGLDHSR